MTGETEIIITITAAMVAAAAGGHLAALVRLPPIVGYLLAGMAIGPFTPLFNADTEVASQLAELGVILLMFGVGIHFSIRDLLAVQRVALPAVIIHTIVITGVMILVMLPTDWSLGASILLGIAATIASTVIVVRALEERHEADTVQGRVSIGWLILEDLLTVFILVLLPPLAESGGDVGLVGLAQSIGITLGKVGLLAAVMVFAGARIVPWLLELAARRNSRELFLLTVLGIAFGIAYTSAALFDVSFALGAFLAGLVVSEADLSHQAAADSLPFQDAFAVIFFVSVGMLVDPAYVLEAPILTAIFVLVIVGVKPLVSWLLLEVLGLSTGAALTAAASRAQIGEFSFILGGLGMSLGVLPDDALNLILTGSIISIVVNPFMYTLAARIREQIERNPEVLRYLPSNRGWPVDLATVEEGEQLRGHAVILGYGRVGNLIGDALTRRDFPFIVVERNRRAIEELREHGVLAIYGDGSHPVILEQLQLDRARVLIVALPDPITSRLAVERARQIAPNLSTVVRAHTEQDRVLFNEMGNIEPVIGERELAIEMTRFTLRRFGLSSMELQGILRGIRFRDEAEQERRINRVTNPIDLDVSS